MAYGKSLELNTFDKVMKYRPTEERETVYRDRSLRGKKRVKARRHRNEMIRQFIELSNDRG